MSNSGISVKEGKICINGKSTATNEAQYKFECYCTNCGAGEIWLKLHKGTRIDHKVCVDKNADLVPYLSTIVCPKCKCQGVKRSHPYGNTIAFGLEGSNPS